MRLGLCLAAYGDRDLRAALAAAHEHGIDAVDLPLDSTFDLRGGARRLRPAQVRGIERLLTNTGIELLCVSNSRDCQLILGPHGPHTDHVRSGNRAAKRLHGLRYATEAIEVAGALECSIVRLFLGCPDYSRWLTWHGSTVSWAENLEKLTAELAGLAGQAENAGVRLCLEPHPKQVVFDLDSTEQMRRLLAEAGLPPVELCIDPANLTAIGHDPVSFIRSLGCVPAMVHAKDVERTRGAVGHGRGWLRYGPAPPIRFRAAGWGEVPWRAVITALNDRGFDGPVVVEHEDLTMGREDSISCAIATLRPLLHSPSHGKRTW